MQTGNTIYRICQRILTLSPRGPGGPGKPCSKEQIQMRASQLKLVAYTHFTLATLVVTVQHEHHCAEHLDASREQIQRTASIANIKKGPCSGTLEGRMPVFKVICDAD